MKNSKVKKYFITTAKAEMIFSKATSKKSDFEKALLAAKAQIRLNPTRRRGRKTLQEKVDFLYFQKRLKISKIAKQLKLNFELVNQMLVLNI